MFPLDSSQVVGENDLWWRLKFFNNRKSNNFQLIRSIFAKSRKYSIVERHDEGIMILDCFEFLLCRFFLSENIFQLT